jgi:selenocysteine lyase/cysteine desulfurase
MRKLCHYRPVPASTTDWPAFRARFPVTERAVYLNTGWSGPSARETVQATQSRLEREAFDGPTTLDVRHEKALLVRGARAALAGLIGAGPDDLALMNTTTEGVNAVLRGLRLAPNDEVITCNLEHSSVMVPCYELRRQQGVDVAIVRSSAEEPLEELAQLFEAAMSARTKLVVLSHISYNRGTRLPVERIIRAAHDAGAFVLLDGAQSAGQIPIDVRALEVDAYAFPAQKYVLGPDGVGALYVRPGLVERIAPPAVAHGASEYYDFEGHYTPVTASMRKFEMTTHSGPLLAGVIAAVELLRELGPENIEARILALASRLIDGLGRIAGAQIRGPLDPALRSGLVTFTVREQDPNTTCAALWQLRRVVGRVVNDKRVRLSVAPFNDEDDIDAALEAIEQLATRGLPPGAMTAQQFKELVAEEDD